MPLVSAIMPTRGRADWAAEAVAMFNAQTYPHRELVIIDDISHRSFPQPSFPANVRYYLEQRLTIGAKRNLSISRATGCIIMHWDSDDIYSADRMEHQVQMLLASDAEIVGYDVMEFVDYQSKERYMYHSRGLYVIGVSMCYGREVWEQRRFPPIGSGEDNEFSAGRRLVACPADGRIVARIHSDNTSEKRASIRQSPHQWKKIA